MTKQEQFLWIIQTAFIANAINLASDQDQAITYRHVFSATGALTLTDEALQASTMIPDSMTAYDAAREFSTFMLDNVRDMEDASRSAVLETPDWFARV